MKRGNAYIQNVGKGNIETYTYRQREIDKCINVEM